MFRTPRTLPSVTVGGGREPAGEWLEPSPVTRRAFLARAAAAAAFAGFKPRLAHAAQPLIQGLPNTKRLGWRVGFSAYTFRGVTLLEALDRIAATGLHHVELFEWQKFSPKDGDATSGPGLSAARRRELKKKAADCGVKMIGIFARLGDSDAVKAVFQFAAEMELQFVVGEPPEAIFDVVEESTEKHNINFALHNHPKPSHYWSPETGLAALRGRSERMGFCCDTGHWCRSGLDPVAMLKRVAPRVKTFHLKDLDQFGVRDAQDVIWGQGKGRIADVLAEVKRQGIKHPYFGIEWERTLDEPLRTHAASVAFFEQVAGTLIAP